MAVWALHFELESLLVFFWAVIGRVYWSLCLRRGAMSQPRILVIGTFDSKRSEYRYLCEQLIDKNAQIVTIDIGTFSNGLGVGSGGSSAEETAVAGGTDLLALQEGGDRGKAMQVMARGAEIQALKLLEQQPFDGVIGMGGSGGSSVIGRAMQSLPLGLAKVLLSTMAGGETSVYVGSKDVTLIPSVVDISGLNRLSRLMITKAAGAVLGMASAEVTAETSSGPMIATSMFGNTTECVDVCRGILENSGYEVLVFHSTGAGGMTMESLIRDGQVEGCLDITTTEIADHFCGGVLSAGADRLSAAGEMGIPHLIAPGCIDMVNFGPIDSVPAQYRDGDRLLYQWNPAVTLMRTNVEENRAMGQFFAEKANAAKGPLEILFPLKGVSVLDGDGERFCDRQADQALFESMMDHLRPEIPVVQIDANINDAVFAHQAAERFDNMMQSRLT